MLSFKDKNMLIKTEPLTRNNGSNKILLLYKNVLNSNTCNYENNNLQHIVQKQKSLILIDKYFSIISNRNKYAITFEIYSHIYHHY